MIYTNNNLDRLRKQFQDQMFKTFQEYNTAIRDSEKTIYQTKNNLIQKFHNLNRKLSKAEQYYLRKRYPVEYQNDIQQLRQYHPIISTPLHRNFEKPFKYNYSEANPRNYMRLMTK